MLFAGSPPRPPSGVGLHVAFRSPEMRSAIAAPGLLAGGRGGGDRRAASCPGRASAPGTAPGGRPRRWVVQEARGAGGRGDGDGAWLFGCHCFTHPSGWGPRGSAGFQGEPSSFGAEAVMQDGGSKRDTPVPGRGAGSQGHRQETPVKEAERRGRAVWVEVEWKVLGHSANWRDRGGWSRQRGSLGADGDGLSFLTASREGGLARLARLSG